MLRDSSIHTAVFSTVTCSEEKWFITARTNREKFLCLFTCGVHQIYKFLTQPIAGLSRTFSLNFQDFPVPENFAKKFQDFPGGVRTMLTTVKNTRLPAFKTWQYYDNSLFN